MAFSFCILTLSLDIILTRRAFFAALAIFCAPSSEQTTAATTSSYRDTMRSSCILALALRTYRGFLASSLTADSAANTVKLPTSMSGMLRISMLDDIRMLHSRLQLSLNTSTPL